MNALDKVLRAAADAIRALPDRELLALALHGSGPDAPPLAEAAAALPTAALRQEVATSAPRPREASAGSAEAKVLEALQRRPMRRTEIQRETSLAPSTVHRSLVALVERGQVVKPTEQGDAWKVRP